MGVVRTWESKRAELEVHRRKMVEAATVHRRKDLEPPQNNTVFGGYEEEDGDEKGSLVCVTSGVSYLGIALVNQLLQRGYTVRITVDNPEDREKVREIKTTEGSNVQVFIAKLTDVDSLVKAFHGCRGLFHTSAFTDPAGLSGYTKSMAEIEVRVTENVMEACARTPSIKRCVFTSSLSACIWQQEHNAQLDHSPTINHESWSSDSLCIEKKLWHALGKMRSEKAAWRIAEEKGIKLTTICSALITGPDFYHRNPTSTVAYLKGAQELYSQGLLATIDVTKLAEAHEIIFKSMRSNATGRYICFDNVIDNQSKAEKLAKEIRMPKEKICGGDDDSVNSEYRYQLSNEKLCRLMSRPLRCFREY